MLDGHLRTYLRHPRTCTAPPTTVTDDGQHVIVTDHSAHCVTVFSNTGEVVSRFGSFSGEPGKFKYDPVNVAAVYADKQIFVVDSTRVQKFTFSSSFEDVYNGRVNGVAIHSTSVNVLCTNRTKHKLCYSTGCWSQFSHSFGDKNFLIPMA